MKLHLAFGGLLIIALSSCTAFHEGSISGGSYPTSPDYELKQMVYGHARTFKILGLGGWNTDALVLEAKQKLRKNYELKPGQAFVNYTVDFTRTFYPFVSTTKVLVSAEVVGPSNQNMSSNASSASKSDIEQGDRVFLKTGGKNWESPIETAYVLEENRNSLKVLWPKNGERPTVRNISPQNTLLIFKSFMSAKEQQTYGFNIGDTVSVNTTQFLKDPRLKSMGEEQTRQGIIVGKNPENVFIIEPLDSKLPEGFYAVSIPAPEQ